MAGVVLKTFKLLVIHNTVAQKSIFCFTKKIASAKLLNSAVCAHARESSFQHPAGAPVQFYHFLSIKTQT